MKRSFRKLKVKVRDADQKFWMFYITSPVLVDAFRKLEVSKRRKILTRKKSNKLPRYYLLCERDVFPIGGLFAIFVKREISQLLIHNIESSLNLFEEYRVEIF